jgi:hypothetical protein
MVIPTTGFGLPGLGISSASFWLFLVEASTLVNPTSCLIPPFCYASTASMSLKKTGTALYPDSLLEVSGVFIEFPLILACR